jgi:nitroimidazol reductase NimA-like FMN-containing flavoprotein (pyridoxamine 5'-phosphate oxidase superfamily)
MQDPRPVPVTREPTPLARVRRRPDRARYDPAAVYDTLDAAPFCHVAMLRDRRPVVLPMAHARVGDAVVLHGSPAAGLFRDARRGSPVCLTATILDGLVLARSATNHSMNYRCVTVHGRAVEITDAEEVIIGMRALVEHLVPGRWEQVRKPTADELRRTAMWRVMIEDASVKSRSGPPADPPEDVVLPVWAGQVPARLVFGQAEPAEGMPPTAPGTVAVNPGLAAGVSAG